MLYMKRDAFRHETEWRAAIYSASEDRTTPKSGIAIPVDPHFLIENIMLDPRAPGELIDAFKFYFEKNLDSQAMSAAPPYIKPQKQLP